MASKSGLRLSLCHDTPRFLSIALHALTFLAPLLALSRVSTSQIDGKMVEIAIAGTRDQETDWRQDQGFDWADAMILLALYLLRPMRTCGLHYCRAPCPHIPRIPQTTPRTPRRRTLEGVWNNSVGSWAAGTSRLQ